MHTVFERSNFDRHSIKGEMSRVRWERDWGERSCSVPTNMFLDTGLESQRTYWCSQTEMDAFRGCEELVGPGGLPE